MDAIITAGGCPRPKEPLYALTQGGYKAMLDIHGKPMIQWVLDAVNQSSQVDRVVIVGLPIYTDLILDKPFTLIEDHGGMLENLRAGVDELRRFNPQVEHVLTISSDIPTITAEMVDWMVERVRESDHDAYYNVIPQEVMEQRFPGSRRSFTRLKDLVMCGGDLNAVRASAVSDEKPVYQRLVSARKNSFSMASLVGLDTLLYLMLHRLSIQEVEQVVQQRIGLHGRAILCPYAEIGMDVDKPGQLELVTADLGRTLGRKVGGQPRTPAQS